MRKRNMRRKVVGILVTAVMSTTVLLSGCGAKESADAGNTQEAGKVEAPVKTEESKVENKGDSGKMVELDLVCGENIAIPEEKDNFIEQGIKEALGIDLRLNVIGTGPDYATALNARISGGDMPDMFFLPEQKMDYLYQYADSGVIMSLDNYMEELAPLMEWSGEENLRANYYKDKMWLVPQKPQTLVYDEMLFRKDWIDAIGAEAPKTIDDMLELSKRLTFDDPDGNGKNDTFGFSGPGLGGFDAIMNPYGVSIFNHFVIRDNEVQSTMLLPNMPAALEKCKEFVDAGVTDPDMVANTWDTLGDKMAQGKLGLVKGGWSGTFKQMQQDEIKAINPNAEWLWFDQPDAGAGEPAVSGIQDMANTKGRWCISAEVEKDPEKLQAVFKLLNWMVTEEGQRLTCYGVEGRHYNIENGVVVPTELMGKECNFTWVYALVYRDDSVYLPTKFVEAKDAIDFCVTLGRLEVYTSAVVPPADLHKEDMDRYIQDNMISFIYGKRPIAEYDQFIQELNDNFRFNEYVESAKQQLKDKGYVQ